LPVVGSNAAFLLIMAGLLLIYGEFIWVGKVWFGLAGSACALAGVAAFWGMPHATVGPVFLIGAVVFFLIESAFETFRAAGILGSALWAAGFWKLGVSPPVVLGISGLFGVLTIWLLSIAKRARRNKRLL